MISIKPDKLLRDEYPKGQREKKVYICRKFRDTKRRVTISTIEQFIARWRENKEIYCTIETRISYAIARSASNGTLFCTMRRQRTYVGMKSSR
jgi:hypothetical protein